MPPLTPPLTTPALLTLQRTLAAHLTCGITRFRRLTAPAVAALAARQARISASRDKASEAIGRTLNRVNNLDAELLHRHR